MIRRGSWKFACVVCAAIASSANHILQCYPHLSCMDRGRQARGRQWRARLRVKYTFDYRHKGPLSDPTRVETVARRCSIVWPQNVTPIRQFAVCVMSRLLGSANEYAVLGIRRAWAPYPCHCSHFPSTSAFRTTNGCTTRANCASCTRATLDVPNFCECHKFDVFRFDKTATRTSLGPDNYVVRRAKLFLPGKSSAMRRYSIPKPKSWLWKSLRSCRSFQN